MASTISSPGHDRPRKMLAARLDRSESPRKNLAPDEQSRLTAEENARIVAEVLRFSKLTPQQLGGRLGHADQTQVSRWLNRQENATVLLKLWAVASLRAFVVMALIEVANNPLMRVRLIAEVEAQAVTA